MKTYRPATEEVRSLFIEEIDRLGGQITDTFHHQERLIMRSVLPVVREVRPGDDVQGGIALRMTGPEVCIHPYIFRLVCTNGAIVADALYTQRIRVTTYASAEEASEALREAIRANSVREAFTHVAAAMRTAREEEADVEIERMGLLSRLPPETGARYLEQVMARYLDGGDRSRFGFMNAVTSTARDASDPEIRWRLEEFGGGIALRACSAPVRRDAGGLRMPSEARELVIAG